MPNIRHTIAVAGLLFSLMGGAGRAETPYAERGPVEPYLSPSREAEIALALSAAPPSISNDAEVLVLDRTGYEIARKGKNGFTCLVERSWDADFEDVEFWNPKIRGPNCFNAAATRTVVPTFLKRTEWVLSGASKAELLKRTRAAVAKGEIRTPEAGAMCFMLSKDGYLGDRAGGHWHPHLMFYLPRMAKSAWGAGLKGSPVFGGPLDVEPVSLFIVPVTAWSDGSPGPMNH